MKNSNIDILSEECDDVESSSTWLTTFADLFTLLFAFFVMIAGSSAPDSEKFDEIRKSISKALDSSDTNMLVAKLNLKQENKESLISDLKQSLKESGADKEVDLTVHAKGVLLTLPPEILFKEGSANINENAKKPLLDLKDVLNQEKYLSYKLAVTGHTDSLPISTLQFPSNWELSASRAASVMSFLTKNGLKKRAEIIIGYANSKPLVKINDTMTEEELMKARQKNRRIEIFISYDKEKQW